MQMETTLKINIAFANDFQSTWTESYHSSPTTKSDTLKYSHRKLVSMFTQINQLKIPWHSNFSLSLSHFFCFESLAFKIWMVLLLLTIFKNTSKTVISSTKLSYIKLMVTLIYWKISLTGKHPFIWLQILSLIIVYLASTSVIIVILF